MADVVRDMLNEDDSPAECREARRRRIERRRLLAVARTPTSMAMYPDRGEKRPDSSERRSEGKRNRTTDLAESPVHTSSSSMSSEEEQTALPSTPPTDASTSEQSPVIDATPGFGTISVSGRSREMEDAVSVQTEFCRPDATGRQPLHFFAVFDGHGGSHVATLCKERMHLFLEDELMRVWTTGADGNGEGSSAEQERRGVDMADKTWRSALVRGFERMDEVALSTCACGGDGAQCGCERAGLTSEIVGSTAVVAILTSERIIVANCGDSRAVLCRGGRAIPLSSDHKPDRPDELARIEVAGGRVIYLNGARVLGILAMSRAFGDKYLKPIVISEPEITFTERRPDDECLILASDGLWDVISNEMACDVARRCLYEGSPAAAAQSTGQPIEDVMGGVYRSRCTLAAALLTRLALGRKSVDNISVIVIDLKRD